MEFHRDPLGKRLAQRLQQPLGFRLLTFAINRAIGPGDPPVSTISPAACAANVSNETCAGSDGSVSKNPRRTAAADCSSPTASCASSTSGSGASRGFSARVSAIWQPTIGCTPFATQAWLNSSAPNRLFGIGDRHGRHARIARQRRQLVRLDRPLTQRIR